jgi:hypothetical protein
MRLRSYPGSRWRPPRAPDAVAFRDRTGSNGKEEPEEPVNRWTEEGRKQRRTDRRDDKKNLYEQSLVIEPEQPEAPRPAGLTRLRSSDAADALFACFGSKCGVTNSVHDELAARVLIA